MKDPSGQKLNVELKIRKEGGTAQRSSNAPNIDRGRNNNVGSGMNRNGSGGRGGDRRDGGNRSFQRSDRTTVGRNGANANGSAAQHANARR